MAERPDEPGNRLRASRARRLRQLVGRGHAGGFRPAAKQRVNRPADRLRWGGGSGVPRRCGVFAVAEHERPDGRGQRGRNGGVSVRPRRDAIPVIPGRPSPSLPGRVEELEHDPRRSGGSRSAAHPPVIDVVVKEADAAGLHRHRDLAHRRIDRLDDRPQQSVARGQIIALHETLRIVDAVVAGRWLRRAGAAVAVRGKRVVLRSRRDRGRPHRQLDGGRIVHAQQPARPVVADALDAPVTVAVPALIERRRRGRLVPVDRCPGMGMPQVPRAQDALQRPAHGGAVQHRTELRHAGVDLVTQQAARPALDRAAIELLVKVGPELVHLPHQEPVGDEPDHLVVREKPGFAVCRGGHRRDGA